MDLHQLIEKYRKGRDGFDSLAVAATQLYLSGQLLPPSFDEETTVSERVQALTVADLERALDGNLGSVPMTREEFNEVLFDIVEFLKEWLVGEGLA